MEEKQKWCGKEEEDDVFLCERREASVLIDKEGGRVCLVGEK